MCFGMYSSCKRRRKRTSAFRRKFRFFRKLRTYLTKLCHVMVLVLPYFLILVYGWLGVDAWVHQILPQFTLLVIAGYVLWLSLPLACMGSSCFACCAKEEYRGQGRDIADGIYSTDMGGRTISKVTTGSPPTKHDIFISYRSEDSEQVYNSLLTRLSEKELNVFNSARDFAGATPSKALMGQHAAGSVVLLALVSPNYFDSPWCRHEAVSAKKAGVPIIPVYSGAVRVCSVDFAIAIET